MLDLHNCKIVPSGFALLPRVGCALVLIGLSVTSSALPGEGASAQCRRPHETPVLSFADLPQAPLPLNVTELDGADAKSGRDMRKALVHLNIRNAGSIRVPIICATAYLTENSAMPRVVPVSLTAFQKAPTADEYKTDACLSLEKGLEAGDNMIVDLHFRLVKDWIPLTGVVSITGIATSKESAAPESSGVTTNIERGDARSHAVPLQDCSVATAPITRPILILPPKRSFYALLPFVCGLLVGGGFLMLFLCKLSGRLRLPMGSPQWSFSGSFATNFTLGTAILTLIFSTSVVPDGLHFMTKQSYSLLSIAFAALLLFGPAFYTFCGTPQTSVATTGESSISFVGTVRLFLLTSTLVVFGFVGQIITISLLLMEGAYLGYINSVTMAFCFAYLILVTVSMAVYAYKSISAYADQQAHVDKVERIESQGLQTLIREVAPLKWNIL